MYKRQIFYYPDFNLTINYSSPENLPVNVPASLAGWRLTALHINLIDKNGKTADSIVIDRLLRGGN